MSGLLHLVEAATALSQMYPAQPSSTMESYQVPFQQQMVSTTPAGTTIEAASMFARRSSTHTVSDDDTMMGTSSYSKIEDHLQALRAAAFAAGLTPSTDAPSTSPVYTQQQQQPTSITPPAQVTTTTLISSQEVPSKQVFPMRLHAVLADPTVRDIISWLPHGKSFVVIRPDVFATDVLPRYFSAEGPNSVKSKKTSTTTTTTTTKKVSKGAHKYPSFTRKLNRWGFKQISRGPDAGAFCHELFQRDDIELCRGMECQKSRKSRIGGGSVSDDMMSVSSASTMGTKQSIASAEKRPYSSTVTISTAGDASGSRQRNLPFKKRKSGQYMTNNYDIPSMISHRPQKMESSTTSMTESDLTSDGSVCSNNNNSNNNAVFPVALLPKSTATAAKIVVEDTSADLSAEAAAREALARHFHEQHRAFALASLMENSRLAMEAAGLKTEASTSNNNGASASQQQVSSQCMSYPGAITTYSPMVYAPTVGVVEDAKMPAVNTFNNTAEDQAAASVSAAESAKNELYKAFLQALSCNGMSAQSS